MKIDRYQGQVKHSGGGIITDHQYGEWVVKFQGLKADKAKELIRICLEYLNEETE